MKQKEKIREFSRLPKQELQRNLSEKRERLRQLRFDLASGKVKNVREIREIKRDIASIMTIFKNKNQDLIEPPRAEKHA
jgi:ribosomal protein L29